MPVVSPSRFSATSGAGLTTSTYRSSLTTSPSFDRTYFSRSTSYCTNRSTLPSTTSDYRSIYGGEPRRERNSISDYRSPEVRARLERSESRGRELNKDSKGDSVRNGSVGRSSILTSSPEDFYAKYSPSNYVPLSQRLNSTAASSGDISRSKSISNDIGRPPTISETRNSIRKPRTLSTTTNGEKPKTGASPAKPTTRPKTTKKAAKDSNGNDVHPSVAEIRKKFDQKMAVTKIPSTDSKYTAKVAENYLNQLKNCHNGTISYTKVLAKLDQPVPVHNVNGRSDSVSSRSDSNSDLSAKNFELSPKERVKNQIVPNNPINRVLEKSTIVKTVEKNSPDVNNLRKNFELTPFMQNSTPIVSSKVNKAEIQFIDDSSELSPSEVGYENKTFDLIKRDEVSGASETYAVAEVKLEKDEMVNSVMDGLKRDNHRKKVIEKRETEVSTSPISQYKEELVGGKSAVASPTTTVQYSVRHSDRDRSSAGPSSTSSGLNGLRNIGNTCFMNSVIQCLSNTRLLRDYLVEDRYLSDINTSLSCMKGALIKAFASVIKELWREGESDGVVNTTGLKAQVQRFAPRFMGYSQQDAQEFLRYLLEGLHEEVNRVTSRPKPILTEIEDSLSDEAKATESWRRYLRMEDSRVGDIFVGQLKSTLRCTHCNHDSVTFDPFWDLSLPIPSKSGCVRIQQCLQHFTKHEELDGDEKPTCSKCGVRRKMLKWFTIQKFPKVLVLHLKRFSPTERFRGKLSVVVEFPLTGLEMGPFAANTNSAPNYNLYAVSNHSGTTYSGHYTAYCKHPFSNEWHEYNDSRVSTISQRSVVSSEAYVLFYELSNSTSSHL